MCSITCANTSLPWFIDHPREVVLRRVAEPASAVQIETKINHHLLTYDQHFKKPNCRNVGTLLMQHESMYGMEIRSVPARSAPGGATPGKHRVGRERLPGRRRLT